MIKKIILLFVVIIIALVIAAIMLASQGRFGISLVPVFLFPGVILVFIFSLIHISRKNKEKLLITGIPAKASVLSVSDTGVTINNNPRVALQLKVIPQNGLPFNAKVYCIVSRLQPLLYQPMYDITGKV